MNGDSYFNSVALGLAGDSFVDFSNYSNAITNNGISLTNKYPGILRNSWLFTNPTPAILVSASLPAGAQLVANEDFTLEVSAFIVTPIELGGTLISTRDYSNGGVKGLYLGYTSDGTVFLRATYNGHIVVEIDAVDYLNLNTPALHSFCVTRHNGQWTLFVDGVPLVDINHTSYYAGALDIGPKMCFGGDGFEPNLVGTLSQIRYTVGVARYTAQYVPLATSFPTYYTVNGVAPSTFGDLTFTVSTANQPFASTVNITNVATATVTVTTATGVILANNWTLTNLSGNLYTLSGIAPAPLITYLVTVSVTIPAQYGGGVNSHVYKITNTANGTLTAGQALLTKIKSLSLWLDSSNSTTVVSNSTTSAINQILDMSGGIPFSKYGSSSPVIDSTSFTGLNAIAFSNVSVSGLTTNPPVLVGDANGDSTIFLVGKYSGQQLGQGAGTFSIGYAPDATLSDGTANWDIVATNVGSAAYVQAYDNSIITNAVTTAPIITSGEKFLAVWNSSKNVLSIYVNQVLISTSVLTGTANIWSSINSAIGFIGGASAPHGAFISVGELVAFNASLDINTTQEVEGYLNHKWGLYVPVPYSTTPDTLVGYVSSGYQAHVIIEDATSVSITATAGTGWTIIPAETGVVNQYLISGTMPELTGFLNITISMLNGLVSGSNTFTLQVQELPNVPVVSAPTNLACQINTRYVGLIEILSATSVSVSASSGSGWTITPLVNGVNNYLIIGDMPSEVGTLTLTITAVGSGGNATPSFTIAATPSQIALSTQYPIDLTASLSSNLISNETQTLTALNGTNQRLIQPKLNPFFSKNFVLQYYDINSNLVSAVKGTDYFLIDKLQDISRVTASNVHTTVWVVNPNITGTVYLTYQTLGGNFALDKKALYESIIYANVSSASTLWSRIIGKPTYFPVNDHQLNVQTEAVGLGGLLASINALSVKISAINPNTDLPAMIAHMGNVSNPHGLTKAQIGLPNVQNYPLATNTQANAGTSTTTYLTPATAYISAMANFVTATSTVVGGTTINKATSTSDAVDGNSYITAANLISFATDQGIVPTFNSGYIIGNMTNAQATANAIVSLIPPTMIVGQITPTPLTFPLWWNGKKYTALSSLVADISAYVGMGILPYSSSGMIWFPPTITIPNLATTSTAVYGTLKRSVKGTVSQPLATIF